MPYIRFSRDRRGYEHTYIMHAAARRGKKQARLLYWFRTPPNVKVGRAPLDEEAIRAIEEHNPDLTFDWTRILEARPAPAPVAEPARGGARRRREREPAPAARPAGGRTASRGAPAPPVARPVEPPPAPPALAEPPEPVVETVAPPIARLEVRQPVGEPVSPLPESARPVPAEELVGAEGLARLRTRYAEVQARITERDGEADRLEQLRREAERLNPDAWVTLGEARQGLEEFETVFEELRRAVGRRRRSRRGGVRRSRRRRALAEARRDGTAAGEGEAGAAEARSAAVHPDESEAGADQRPDEDAGPDTDDLD